MEAVLLGETVELATGFKFKTLLESCTSIAQAADMIRDACQCGLMTSMELARQKLQELAAVSSEMKMIAHPTFQLSQVARYGDVRKFDPAPLLPLMEELFVSGAVVSVWRLLAQRGVSVMCFSPALALFKRKLCQFAQWHWPKAAAGTG